MKQYKVNIIREALQDMEDIYNYIAVDLLSPENADEPLEYVRLALDGEMQAWVDAIDSLEVW